MGVEEWNESLVALHQTDVGDPENGVAVELAAIPKVGEEYPLGGHVEHHAAHQFVRSTMAGNAYRQEFTHTVFEARERIFSGD